MKLFPAEALAITSIAVLLALPGTAQTQTSADPAQQQSAPPPSKSADKVIFERSLDSGGNTVSATGPAAQSAAHPTQKTTISDVERQSVTVTGLDIDLRLDTSAHQLAARATVELRNAGKLPLTQIPLQISSSLNWERIRSGGRDLPFVHATINSDADHTGQLHEAAIQLPQPLDSGKTLQLEVIYSGTVTQTARRLISIGTPEDSAIHSDWDEISAAFTGLRGFGNVVWYPVVSTPVMIGDGARLFDEIGTQRLRNSGSAFRLRLTAEFPHGEPPTIAAVNGAPLKLNISDSNSTDVPGIATGDTGPTTMSFAAPSLFISTGKPHLGTHLTAYTIPEDDLAVKSWVSASASVSPMIERWLGPDPRSQLILIDLPDPEDKPWESGPLLAIALRDGPAQELDSVLAHALTHAWMAPNPYWLDEGTANFMGTLWDDHEHQRDKALATLDAGRQALALEEPPSPGEGAGQPLARASSPVYLRTKAAYVLWMLRGLVGDEALGAALRASNANSNNAGTPSFQAMLKAAAPGRDLTWLFADWIDADHGLPDLTVEKVFPNAVQSGNWLVSVTISNAGYAAANVPVTVRSATNTTTEHVLVPAHGAVTPRLLVQGRPTQVQVNDGTVPETQASVHVTDLEQPSAPEVSARSPQ